MLVLDALRPVSLLWLGCWMSLLVWVGMNARFRWGLARIGTLGEADPSGDGGRPRPVVSVIVPARNEERSIGKAVGSLLEQEGGVLLEVIAVDDHSTDRTGELLEELARGDERLKVLHLEEDLPAGWLGKPRAMQRGYEHSRGEWLLFTDADIVHHPLSLAISVAYARRERLGLLTLIPRLDMESFWEKCVTPVITTVLSIFCRMAEVNDPEKPYAFGCGAFILVSREAYEDVGTHEALRSEVLDDVRIAERVKGAGHGFRVLWAQDLISVRMYESLRQIVDGFTKNLFDGAQRSWFRVFVLAGFVFTVWVLPALVLLGSPWLPAEIVLPGLASVVLGLVMHLRIGGLMGAAGHDVLAYPAGGLMTLYIVLRSTWYGMVQKKVMWREREYKV